MASQLVSETQIQQAFVLTLRNILIPRYPQLRWFHSIPNGLKLPSLGAAAKAKREGLTAGVADMFLPLPSRGCHGMYLEFKKDKGKQSPSQQAFQQWCANTSYEYHVVRDVKTAVEVTVSYLDLPLSLIHI